MSNRQIPPVLTHGVDPGSGLDIIESASYFETTKLEAENRTQQAPPSQTPPAAAPSHHNPLGISGWSWSCPPLPPSQTPPATPIHHQQQQQQLQQQQQQQQQPPDDQDAFSDQLRLVETHRRGRQHQPRPIHPLVSPAELRAYEDGARLELQTGARRAAGTASPQQHPWPFGVIGEGQKVRADAAGRMAESPVDEEEDEEDDNESDDGTITPTQAAFTRASA